MERHIVHRGWIVGYLELKIAPVNINSDKEIVLGLIGYKYYFVGEYLLFLAALANSYLGWKRPKCKQKKVEKNFLVFL